MLQRFGRDGLKEECSRPATFALGHAFNLERAPLQGTGDIILSTRYLVPFLSLPHPPPFRQWVHFKVFALGCWTVGSILFRADPYKSDKQWSGGQCGVQTTSPVSQKKPLSAMKNVSIGTIPKSGKLVTPPLLCRATSLKDDPSNSPMNNELNLLSESNSQKSPALSKGIEPTVKNSRDK